MTLATMLPQPRQRIALAIVVALIVVAVFAPLVSPFDPITQIDLETKRLAPPSFAHLLGTDDLSRDLLSRILYGARVSLTVAFFAVAVSIVVGTLVGVSAGLAGGVTDTVLMRVVDAALAIPRLMFVIVVLVFWSNISVTTLIVILGLTSWFETSRIVRAEVMSVRVQPYYLAARAGGTGVARLVRRHVLPNIGGTIIVTATLGIGQIILVEAGLSFLGIGVPRPTPSWGRMIAESSDVMASAWWTATFPGLAIAATVLAFSVLGDALRDILNPRAA